MQDFIYPATFRGHPTQTACMKGTIMEASHGSKKPSFTSHCPGRLGTVLFTFLFCVFVFSWSACADEPIEELLDRVRCAMGYDQMRTWPIGFSYEGKGSALNLECRFRSIITWEGRFRHDMKSELSTTMGFDGTRGWMVDLTGMPTSLECDALEITRIRSFVRSGSWLDDTCPLVIAIETDSPEEDPIRLSLSFPGGLITASLEINANSALVSRLTWKQVQDLNHEAYLHYEPVEVGESTFLFPRLIQTCEEQMETSIEIQKITPIDDSAQALLEPVTTRPKDTRYHPHIDPVVELKRLPSGYSFVHPKINGEEKGWFLFDTGCGMNVIDKTVADELGMESIGSYKALGVGGLVDVCFRRASTLSLGPVEIIDPLFIEIDCTYMGKALGIEFGGLLGTGLLDRCSVQLDLSGPTLSLHPPGAFDEADLPWQQIIFYNSSPCVEGILNNKHEGIFLVDSGACGISLNINSGFIGKDELFGDQKIAAGTAGGVGGMVRTYSGYIPSFEISGHIMKNLWVSLMDSKSGVSKMPACAGLVGDGILSRYELVLDYRGKRMAFLPNESE